MKYLLLVVLLAACRDQAPQGPDGTYRLARIGGRDLVTAGVDSGRIELRPDQTFVDVLSFRYLGLPYTDSLSGEWIARPDSIVLHYRMGLRSASKRDQHRLSVRYGGDVWEYVR